MTRIKFALLALLLTLTALPLLAWKDDKIHFVDYVDAKGQHHVYALKAPVSGGDALALRGAVIGLALEKRNGAEREDWSFRNNTIVRSADASFDSDAFLMAASAGSYTDNGSLCYITMRSGARVYYCGDCGGLGCAQVRAITN